MPLNWTAIFFRHAETLACKEYKPAHLRPENNPESLDFLGFISGLKIPRG